MEPSRAGVQELEDLLLLGDGLVTQTAAISAGIARGSLQRLARSGTLRAVAKGVYVSSRAFEDRRPWDRFALRSRAFVLSHADDSAACDLSALAIAGLPRLGLPPALPRVLRPGTAHTGHSRTSYGKVRYGWLPPERQTEFGAVRSTDLALTCVDVARMGSRLQALMVADFALAHGVHREVLTAVTEMLRLHRGIGAARWMIEHADGRAESPLETAGRLICLQSGLPPVVANPWILDGTRAWRVDLLMADHGIVLEADGALKYNDRPDAATVVENQVLRQEALRGLGFDVVRFGARIAYREPAELPAKVHRLIQLRRGVPAPTCWQLQNPYAA